MHLDILGLAEERWLKSRKLLSNEYMLTYSGHTNGHTHGRGMRLNKQMSKAYMAHYAISSRRLLVKLHSKPCNLTLSKVYVPTNTSEIEDMD